MTAQPPLTTPPAYQAQHLRDRLAHEDIADLGVRGEVRAGAVLVRGAVADPRCRETVLRIAGEALHPPAWRHDPTMVAAGPPDRAEDLS
ncbi:hypothetical protein ACIRP0_05740 [Streptomyces sp. NPDC101733]|uniref:hypothetical protein n=1 Tax=unclassified Streptomyces TaxID=2593676 RepID=UPI003827B631